MTRNQLASVLCKAEGKKSQVKIGDMREVVKILFGQIKSDYKVRKLFRNALRESRAK